MFLRVSNPNLVLNINCLPLPSFFIFRYLHRPLPAGQLRVGFLVVLCSATWSVFLRPVGILGLVMLIYFSHLPSSTWLNVKNTALGINENKVTFRNLQTYCPCKHTVDFRPIFRHPHRPARNNLFPESVQFFSQRYLRRRKYKLFACFSEASMVACTDGHVTFEISIGKVHLW